MRTLLKPIAAMVLVAVVTPITSAGVMLAAYLFLPLPAHLPERVPPAPSQISRVYDAAGNEIATYKQFETSIPVAKSDIPEVLKQAVIAAEDRSFYSHGGFDVRGTLRALWADIRNRELGQGGSTITQQLVKNTVTGGEKTIQRKIREAVLASQLDRQMEKEDILFEYLSIIYLGEGAYGVGAAATTYFQKEVSQLTLSESALLASVIPAPSRFSPRVDPALAEQRRVRVLGQMLDEEMITPVQHDEAVAQTVWLTAAGPPPPGVPVTLVHPAERQTSTNPYFTDYVFRWLEANLPGGTDQIYRGGLRIDTTIQPEQQAAAEAAVAGFLDGRPPDLRTSLVAVEPPTGFVRAFVSGRDFAADQVNYALGLTSAGGVRGGGSGRQPGSAFKPFVLATALTAGITPDAIYSGAPHDVSDACIGTEKPLENYEGGRYGNIDLRAATVRSVNTAYTRLILDVGVGETMDLARRMGLTSVSAYDPTVHCASVALGAESVSPLDMASAYGVFAARGERAEPTPVVRVTDRDGTIILDNSEPATTRAIDEPVADNVTDILRGVLVNGTAAGRGINRPAAGKTGTTQENKDAWFVGFTPTLSTAVWIGYENKTVETAKTLGNITGGSFPARIWQRFMREALAGVPVTEFSEPAPIESVPDAAKLAQRGGFAPGVRRTPAGPPAADWVEDVEPPPVDAPTTTTLPDPTTSSTSSTTSTTTGGGIDGLIN